MDSSAQNNAGQPVIPQYTAPITPLPLPSSPTPMHPPLDWQLILSLAGAFVFVLAIFLGATYLFGAKQYYQVPKTDFQAQYNPGKPTPILSSASATSSNKNDTAQIAAWKTYTNTPIGLKLNYPPQWDIKETPTTINENGTKEGSVDLSGQEGSLHAAWGKGFGGGCDQINHETIQIFGKSYDVCHYINADGTETWSGIDKDIDSHTSFSMNFTANTPHENNRDVLLKIVSTIEFTN